MKDDDDKGGQSKLFAFLDNKRYTEKYKDDWSLEAAELAEKIQYWADAAYVGAKVYKPTPRKKFIAIKVEKPGRNKLRPEVIELNDRLEDLGVEIVETHNKNIVYRVTEDIV